MAIALGAMATSVAIVGVSGLSGIELARLVAARPELELVAVLSDRWAGDRLGRWVRDLPSSGELVVRPMSELASVLDEAEIVALATPAEASAELAPKILARGRRVLDLSGAFRIPDTEVFRSYYRFEHPEPALLAEAHFGLPQLPKAAGDAPPIDEARLVANPGCYATAAILPLAPLLAKGLVEPDALFIDGKSGVTGAGRKVAEKYLFTEVSENLSPYRVGDHQHTPEIELALSRVSGLDARVTFVPNLVPIRRGLLASCFGRLVEGTDPASLEPALREAYEHATSALGRVVEVDVPEEVTVASVWGSARARLGVRGDAKRRSFAAVSAIDNLMKGAASQALENLLRMIG
jgi:N-acetyl-gamma-glutamyl-phosphate reductase